MPVKDIRDLEPFDPGTGPGSGTGGGGQGGFPSIPPGGGGQPPPTDGSNTPTGGNSGPSPWPAWAMAIDSNVQGWRTLDNGNLLHKATNKVYSGSGTFIASLADYLNGEREATGTNPVGPPDGANPGDLWTDPDTGNTWKYYTNLGWMNTTEDPKNPNETGPTTPGGLGGNTGVPDPGDGLIPGAPGGQPPPQVDYIGLPPPTGGTGGGGMANPMPGMPTTGVRGVPPHLAVSRQDGTPVGQREAFKPWGDELGYLSQALRYGGQPTLYEQGGSAGIDAIAAALRGNG